MQQPLVYIILVVDWKHVVDRIYKRFRRAEVENLDKTLIPMQELHKTYVENLQTLCDKLNIQTIYIDTNGKTPEENALEIIEYLDNLKNN
jgi:deoxyadenosine/deoxycytidine kinase